MELCLGGDVRNQLSEIVADTDLRWKLYLQVCVGVRRDVIVRAAAAILARMSSTTPSATVTDMVKAFFWLLAQFKTDNIGELLKVVKPQLKKLAGATSPKDTHVPLLTEPHKRPQRHTLRRAQNPSRITAHDPRAPLVPSLQPPLGEMPLFHSVLRSADAVGGADGGTLAICAFHEIEV